MTAFSLILAAGASSLFNARTVSTRAGDVRVVGNRGPPVVFQTGLFGTIPRFMYREFTDALEERLTLVHPQRSVLGGEELEQIADAIGVEKVGLISHSSVAPSLITSPRVERSVLLDPVIFPAGFNPFGDGLLARRVRGSAPTRILRAGRSTNRFIPESFEVDVAEAEVVVFDEAGHSDVLNDMYADAGSRMGIVGLAERGLELAPFWEWSLGPKRADVRSRRRDYRAALVEAAVSFFVTDPVVEPNDDDGPETITVVPSSDDVRDSN